jgi:hypothetical protein
MKKLLFLILMLSGKVAFPQEPVRTSADSLILGNWVLKNPAQAKIFKSDKEPFLRAVMSFEEKKKCSAAGEIHQWEWTYTPETQSIHLVDTEVKKSADYVIRHIDHLEMIIVLGKKEFVYRRINH